MRNIQVTEQVDFSYFTVMTLQNRVDPFGRLHAVSDRGLFMGNRGGCFHRIDQTLKPTHWASKQWLICLLEFKGRKRKLMSPRSYTELFFLDEATALAAGHRPCYECRRERAIAFRNALLSAGLFVEPPPVEKLNILVSGEVQMRLKGQSLPPVCAPTEQPDGAIYSLNGEAFLVWHGKARRWSFSGYGSPQRLHQTAYLLTPSLTIKAFENGYLPRIHDSIDQA